MQIDITYSRTMQWITAAVCLVAAVWLGMDMLSLTDQERLWAYRPLFLFIASYLFFSSSWMAIRKTSKKHVSNYFIGTAIAVLMGTSFPPIPLLLLIIPAWALFFYLIKHVSAEKRGYQFRLYFHVFILWNIITTYWIGNTAFAAGIVAIFTNALLMSLPVLLYTILNKQVQLKYHFILFAAAWLTFEFFHFRWEAHWPWLTLGHYFMDVPIIIQWYEITGVLGGTLWILGLGWLTQPIIEDMKFMKSRKFILSISALILVPIAISIFLGLRSVDNIGTAQVVIVQPNYEPHYEKRKVSSQTAIRHFLQLADQHVTAETDYLIFPETVFSINLNNWDKNQVVRAINIYLRDYPNLTLISGLATNKILKDAESHDEYTRTHVQGNDTIYWESHNTAVSMSYQREYELYYKSKLVPGAEFFPIKKLLFFIKPLVDKLGGSASGLRSQAKRSTFIGNDSLHVAPVICYESIFGEYVSAYFDENAEWIAVMTNDGWWDNTAGHQQHLGLSVLRAIEQRKWIARAANTGISCFIDEQGKIHEATEYDEATAVTATISANRHRTVYSKAGDLIGRLAVLIALGTFLLHIVRQVIGKRKKK